MPPDEELSDADDGDEAPSDEDEPLDESPDDAPSELDDESVELADLRAPFP